MLAQIIVGSDISSKWFDVCFLDKKGGTVARYDNTSKGHAKFIQDARTLAKKIRLCMEHTGGYETALAIACNDAGFKVSIVDGAQISTYRKSFGSAKAKTDLKDSQLLAKYCEDRKPAQWVPEPDEYRVLLELVKHREDLIEIQTMVRNQSRRASENEYVTAHRKALLADLKLEIKASETEIKKHVQASEILKEEIELLDTIPGIAFISAAVILSETGPISKYADAKKYALAAGLVPIAFQSGKKTPPGKLPVYGNRSLRCAFYFPAVVNIGKPNIVGQFMKRIEKNGTKAKMTVIVAGMRKIAHIVFGVLKSRTQFDPAMI